MNFNKEIILNTIQDFLTTFSKEYTKNYIIAIINDIMEGDEKDNTTPRVLNRYVPECDILTTEVKYSKDGSSSTKSQYWRTNENWEIEIYAKEADAKLRDEQIASGAEKPKEPLRIINPFAYDNHYWAPPQKEFPKRRGGPEWVSDKDRLNCKKCDAKFATLTRRHHCRTCGEIFCGDCSSNKWPLYKMGYPEPQKVCDPCFETLSTKGVDALGPFPAVEDVKNFGVSLTHECRAPLFWLVETSDERSKWYQCMSECIKYASPPRNKNPMMAQAFEKTHRYMWNTQGPWWRWWKVFGTEEEMLTALLAHIVERRCMSTVMAGLGVPSAFRSTAEKSVKGMVEGMISSAIAKAWPVTVEQVGKLEDPMREKLTPVLEPIGTAKAQIMDSLREKLGGAITSAIDTCAKPLLEKVLPMVFGPLLNSHILSYGILNQLVEMLKEDLKSRSDIDMNRFEHACRNISWRVWYKLNDSISADELQPMESNLRMLGGVPPFNYLNPYGMRRAIFDNIEDLLNDAIYTIKQNESIRAAVESKGDVIGAISEFYPTLSEMYYTDSKTVVSECMEEILTLLIGVPIRSTVFLAPGAEDTLNASEGAIPEALCEFMSICDMFDQLLDNVIGDVVSNTVQNNAVASFARLDEGHKGMNE